MARVITVTSGKGGVGKTSISLNLSLSLAQKGFKVCLFDADLGLANVNILTGLYPKRDLETCISGKCDLDQIVIKDYQGIDIIPGSSGVEKLAGLSITQTSTLIKSFLSIKNYDYFIFDTSAGISSQVLSFCLASHEIILVVTTEPTSLTDAYSMLKVLNKYQYTYSVKIVLNRVSSGMIAKKAYTQLKKTSDKYLSVKIEPLGVMVDDKNVQYAVIAQKPFILKTPKTIASKCIANIAAKLINSAKISENIPLDIFWTKCLAFMDKYHSPPKKDKNQQLNDFRNSFDQKNNTESFKNIEDQLSRLMEEVISLKALLHNQHSTPDKKTKMSNIVPWSKTKKNSQESENSVEKVINKVEPNLSANRQNSKKPVVRGHLRNPTDEELANWNEDEEPVAIKSYS